MGEIDFNHKKIYLTHLFAFYLVCELGLGIPGTQGNHIDCD